MHQYGNKLTLTESHLNKKDLALQARTDSGELVAFMWAGFMANGTVVYIDKVVCRPDYSGSGVVRALYAEALRIGVSRGVREAFGIIRQDQYHDKAAANALKTAFGSDGYNYTYVVADIQHCVRELQLQETA
jgi:predicted GNAT superfamily acetyltransferase